MKRKMLVIFDLDGTLFRTETVDISAFNRAFEAYGLRKRPAEEILDCIGMTMHEVCKKFGIDDGSEEKFTKDVIAFEKEEIELSGCLYEGAEELLRKLKASGLVLCICSNGTKEYVRSVLDKFGLYELFNEVWAQTDGIDKNMAVSGLVKRHEAEIFAVAGDRSSDIEAARVNGGISIGMSHGFGGEEVLSADYIADGISGLEEIINGILERNSK